MNGLLGVNVKKVVLVIVALVLVLALTSCGASNTVSGESTSTPNASATSTPAAPVNQEVPRPFEVSENTPEYFQDALKTKETLLVLFYGDDAVSQEVAETVSKLHDDQKYQGVVRFLLLKVGEDDQTTGLARDFTIGYIPYVAVLNGRGTVVFEKQGYFDAKVLNQAIYDATNK